MIIPRLIPKSAVLLILALIAVGILLFTLQFWFLSDQFLCQKIQTALQHGINHTGLQLSIGRLRWDGWNHITGRDVVLRDRRDGSIPFKATQIKLRFNLFALISDLRHPEVCLSQVEIFNPQMRLYRESNGQWNWQRYIKHRRQLRFATNLIIKDGQLDLEDSKYGLHLVKEINGKINLKKYPEVAWDLNGITDLDRKMSWVSHGAAEIDQHTGSGSLRLKQAPLSKITSFLPQRYELSIKSGRADLEIGFAWQKKGLTITNGQVQILEALISHPRLGKELRVAQLDLGFANDLIKVKRARLFYDQTRVKVSGVFNTKTKGIKGELSADAIALEDLARIDPRLKQFALNGTGSTRLAISGKLRAPQISGEAFLDHAQLSLANGERVDRISGRLMIDRNNIEVKRLEGAWHHTLVGVTGKVNDFFDPRFDLRFYGEGLEPDEISNGKFQEMQLGFDGKTSFTGELTGSLKDLTCAASLKLGSLTYRKIDFSNLEVQLVWNSVTRSLVVPEISGKIWDGDFSGQGELRVGPQTLDWDMEATLKDVNIEKVNFLKDSSQIIAGRINLNSNFKGSWRKGQVFDPGVVGGGFKGTGLQYGNMVFDNVEGVYNWQNQIIKVDLSEAKVGNGLIKGAMVWYKGQLAADLKLADIRVPQFIHSKNLAKSLGGIDGAINGNLTCRGYLNQLNGRIDAVYKPTIGPSVALNGNFNLNNRELELINLEVTSKAGDLILTGKIDWETEPSLALNLTCANLQLKEIAAWFSNNPAIEVDGTGRVTLQVSGNLSNPNIVGQLFLDRPHFDKLAFDSGEFDLRGNLDEIKVTDCHLRSVTNQLEASGSLSRNYLNLNLNGHLSNLESLNLGYQDKKLKGVMDFEGKLTGTPSQPILSAAIKGKDLSWGEYNYNRFAANIVWQGKSLELVEADLSRGETLLNLHGNIFMPGPSLDLDVTVMAVSLKETLQMINLPQVNASGILSGNLSIEGRLKDPIIKARGVLTQGQINAIPVSGEFDLDYSRHQLKLGKIYLRHEAGSLLANGVWEPQKLAKLRLELDNFPIETIRAFTTEYPSKLTGLVDSNIELDWSTNRLNGYYLITASDLTLDQRKLGRLRLRGNLNEQGLTITEGIINNKTGSLTLNGYLPWPTEVTEGWGALVKEQLPNRRLGINLRVKNAPIELINLISFGKFRILKGDLDGRILVTGDFKKPEIYGNVDVNNLQVEIATLPLLVDSFAARLNINKNRISILSARGQYGEGKFELTGEAEFNNYQLANYKLGLTGKRIYYRNHFFDGWSNLDLRLSGTNSNTLLSGDIAINDCKVGLLSLPPARKVRNWRPKLNLAIHTGKNVRYRQMGMADVTVKGAIILTGILGEMRVNGEVDSTTGILTFYGQIFKIEHGKATFKNSSGFKPFINVGSKVTLPKAEVFLTIKGQIGADLALDITSQPYMPEADLYAMLNWSDLRGDKPMNPKNMAGGNVSFVTDALFGELFYGLRKTLHVDFIYLEPDYKQNEYRINVSDYVTEKLFVSYSRSVTSDLPNEKWSFDYNLTPKLVAGYSISADQGNSSRLTYRINF